MFYFRKQFSIADKIRFVPNGKIISAVDVLFQLGFCLCHSSEGWIAEYLGLLEVLQTTWMACPYQAASLQGPPSANWAVLAANDSGNGSGWQQSRQD